MAGFILGAGSGVLAGAAVYYTLATGIAENTALLRSELTNSTRVLESSLSPIPAPASSSLMGPAYPAQTSFSELLRHRWNNALGTAVSSVRDADWSAMRAAAVGAAQGAVDRIGTVQLPREVPPAVGVSTAAAVPASPEVVEDVAKAVAHVDDAARMAKLRAETRVDAPLGKGESAGAGPKRLV